jgi:hypothetical protein
VTTTQPQVARRSPFARAFSDREGNLRTPLLVGLIIAVAFVISLGTFVALMAASAGSPGVLGLWATAAFLFIKLPLLGVVWWILARRRDPVEGGGWTSKECREILDYLEEQARDSAGRPDAATRLAYFAKEAWFVADTAADGDRPAAVDTAVLIEAMATAAGAPVDREGTTRPTGGPAPV